MNYVESQKASTTTYSEYKTLGSGSSGTKSISASTSWPDGSYKIFVRGVDTYNSVSVGKGVVVRIDGTKPKLGTCTISPSTSANKYGASRPTLTWDNASDKNLKQVEYSVNGSNYRKLPDISGSARLLPAFFNETGKYNINVRAVDKAGNYSDVRQFSYL